MCDYSNQRYNGGRRRKMSGTEATGEEAAKKPSTYRQTLANQINDSTPVSLALFPYKGKKGKELRYH